ncbi:Protein of unknown function, partial [Gryllus bimaculatus]
MTEQVRCLERGLEQVDGRGRLEETLSDLVGRAMGQVLGAMERRLTWALSATERRLEKHIREQFDDLRRSGREFRKRDGKSSRPSTHTDVHRSSSSSTTNSSPLPGPAPETSSSNDSAPAVIHRSFPQASLGDTSDSYQPGQYLLMQQPPTLGSFQYPLSPGFQSLEYPFFNSDLLATHTSIFTPYSTSVFTHEASAAVSGLVSTSAPYFASVRTSGPGVVYTTAP